MLPRPKRNNSFSTINYWRVLNLYLKYISRPTPSWISTPAAFWNNLLRKWGWKLFEVYNVHNCLRRRDGLSSTTSAQESRLQGKWTQRPRQEIYTETVTLSYQASGAMKMSRRKLIEIKGFRTVRSDILIHVNSKTYFGFATSTSYNVQDSTIAPENGNLLLFSHELPDNDIRSWVSCTCTVM